MTEGDTHGRGYKVESIGDIVSFE